MSWHRSAAGLWCACFQAYQPDDGGGCPAHPCPEIVIPGLSVAYEATNPSPAVYVDRRTP